MKFNGKLFVISLFLLVDLWGFGLAPLDVHADDSILQQSFALGTPHSDQTQYFLMETVNTIYALDGTRTGMITFRLKLQCVPAAQSGKDGDEYTCVRASVLKDGKEITIPVLAGWSYIYEGLKDGGNKKGPVLGIDHGRFENLKDNEGNALPQDQTYAIYNTFIDFHSIVSVFGAKTQEGKGIQDLHQIGETIIHHSAYSEPALDLGSNVAEGSSFKNGEITLTLKGLSRAHGKSCAMVGYDSGASSFKMLLKPTPNLDVHVVGSSHYKGDIYIDLDSNWVQKFTLDELVVTETTLPTPPNKVNRVVERNIQMNNVDAGEFSQRWADQPK